jgi:hypothetical protein
MPKLQPEDKKQEKKRSSETNRTSGKKEQSIIEKKDILFDKFIKTGFKSLYYDIFLLFLFCFSYAVYLYLTNDFTLGIIYFIFTIICCGIIATRYYTDLKKDIDSVKKDLDILFRS